MCNVRSSEEPVEIVPQITQCLGLTAEGLRLVEQIDEVGAAGGVPAQPLNGGFGGEVPFVFGGRNVDAEDLTGIRTLL